MTSYILLERIRVEDANCIAGFTYGFPSITNFLGFTHALSRKCQPELNIPLEGCAVVCHDYQLRIQDQFYTRFIQSKNPPSTLRSNKKDASGVSPIIEEGKMNITVSILLQCEKSVAGRDDLEQQYKDRFLQWVYTLRLAGGTIHSLQNISFFNDDINLNKLKRKLLPGFVLMDSTFELKKYVTNLQAHGSCSELFDLWTDFFAYKKRAIKHQDNSEHVEWIPKIKPVSNGWFVPLMIGYKGISQLYSASEIEHVRDIDCQFRFVESVYSIGEWRSIHRINNLDDLIWKYKIEDEWYLCRQNHLLDLTSYIDDDFINDEFNFN